jgi:hypothetical protein
MDPVTPPPVSPYLAQLHARVEMLEHKIAERIPKFPERKEEALERAKQHLLETQQLIKAHKEAK